MNRLMQLEIKLHSLDSFTSVDKMVLLADGMPFHQMSLRHYLYFLFSLACCQLLYLESTDLFSMSKLYEDISAEYLCACFFLSTG